MNKVQAITQLENLKRERLEIQSGEFSEKEEYQAEIDALEFALCELRGEPKQPNTRAALLGAAKACVCGAREQQYGNPENNFATIARLWEIYLRVTCVTAGVDVCVMAKDVAMMMALLKIARIATGTATADSFVDLAGYAACGGEIAGGTQ